MRHNFSGIRIEKKRRMELKSLINRTRYKLLDDITRQDILNLDSRETKTLDA